MKEQELALSGFVDESSAAEIGKLLGAKTAIAGKVISFSSQRPSLKQEQKQAFESYIIEKTNPDTEKTYKETKYRKVDYTEYTGNIEVRIGFQFKVISLQTSEVLFSDIIELSSKDKVSYSRYKSDLNKIYPMSGSNVNKSNYSVKRFRKQFSARSELKNEDELVNNLCKDISSRTSERVRKYLD